MKRKNIIKLIVAVVLCLAMVMPYVGIEADAEVDNYAGAAFSTGTSKVTLSILGDSISTYKGISNSTSYNSTIGSNAVYYHGDDYGIVRADTWWQQAIDTLGMELCVNNAWSGSRVCYDFTHSNGLVSQAAWKSRCTELHYDGGDTTGASDTNPNIIAVYLGTNDVKTMKSTDYSTFADNQEAMLAEAEGDGTCSMDFSYYVRMINRMIAKYSSAEIYLFTLMPHESQTEVNRRAMSQWNQSVRDLVTYYQGQDKAVYLVDLYNDTSINPELCVLDKFLVNTLHPNDTGMDAITNCFVSSVLKNSKFFNNGDWRTVEYDLDDAYVVGGQTNVIYCNEEDLMPFRVSLLPTREQYDLDVKVEWYYKGPNYDSTGTYGWYDITSWAYSGGTIHIPGVLNSKNKVALRITAKATYETKNYRWEWKDGVLESCMPDGKDYNVVGGIDFNDTTVLATDGINTTDDWTNKLWTNSTNKGTYFGLNDAIVLRNDEPWVIEWQDTGYIGYGNTMMAEKEEYETRSQSYFWRGSHSNGTDATTDDNVLGFGYFDDYINKHITLGVCLGSEANTYTETTYRLVNVINDDGSNMVYLYREGVEVGPLQNLYHSSTPQTEGDATKDKWISGRDFVFSYFGSLGKMLRSSKINYIQVWEGGDFDTLRLEQLLEEADEFIPMMEQLFVENGQAILEDGVLKDLDGVVVNSSYSTDNDYLNRFAMYLAAVENARNYVKDINNTQKVYDEFASELIKWRNALYLKGSGSDAQKVISYEIVTGKAYAGKQVGVQVVTGPQVNRLQVRNQTESGKGYVGHTFTSCKLQYIKIDGEETLVKIWLLGFEAPEVGTYDWWFQTNSYVYSSYWSDFSFEVI